MNAKSLIFVMLLVFFNCIIFAQVSAGGGMKPVPGITPIEEEHDDFDEDLLLTNTGSGFIFAGWNQFGMGITIRHLIFLASYNSFGMKNYQKSISLEEATAVGDIIHDRYDSSMHCSGGILLRATDDLFPFFTAGMRFDKERIVIKEVNPPYEYSGRKYTIDGKTGNAFSGGAGIIYAPNAFFSFNTGMIFNPFSATIGVGICVNPITQSLGIGNK